MFFYEDKCPICSTPAEVTIKDEAYKGFNSIVFRRTHKCLKCGAYSHEAFDRKWQVDIQLQYCHKCQRENLEYGRQLCEGKYGIEFDLSHSDPSYIISYHNKDLKECTFFIPR
jgi:hypothetical protein